MSLLQIRSGLTDQIRAEERVTASNPIPALPCPTSGIKIAMLLLIAALIWPLTVFATASAQIGATPTGIVSLASLRDRARPLLVFAPKPNDPQLEIQLRRLHDNAAATAERDVVVIAVPYESPSSTQAVLTDNDAQAARRRFNVAPGDFTVILIGKDGGEKLRSSRPISIDKLRDTVDALPMRQQEMRNK